MYWNIRIVTDACVKPDELATHNNFKLTITVISNIRVAHIQ